MPNIIAFIQKESDLKYLVIGVLSTMWYFHALNVQNKIPYMLKKNGKVTKLLSCLKLHFWKSAEPTFH